MCRFETVHGVKAEGIDLEQIKSNSYGKRKCSLVTQPLQCPHGDVRRAESSEEERHTLLYNQCIQTAQHKGEQLRIFLQSPETTLEQGTWEAQGVGRSGVTRMLYRILKIRIATDEKKKKELPPSMSECISIP